MIMRIQHNIMAMNSYRNYTNNVSAMKKNLEKLSSGYKINRAGDDAAGLAISEKMRAQITGLETAQKNAKDGISLVQTAEGALTEVHDMLNRMFKLAEQSANGTYDDTTDRDQLQKEVTQLTDEINRIADSSNFNGIKLLDGSLGGGGAKLTNLDISVGKALGTAGTALAGGTAAAGAIVTGWTGATGLNGNYKIATGAMSDAGVLTPGANTGVKDIVVTVTDADGKQTNYTAKIADILTIRDKDGKVKVDANGKPDPAAAGADGDTATLDLSFAGLGKIELQATAALTNWDASIAGALNTATGKIEDSNDAGGLKLQIGDTADDYNQLTVSIEDMHADALGIGGISIADQDGASAAMSKIKDAINYVSNARGTLGATQNRLDHTINNLSVMEENIQDAESTIRDTDVADEMMAYTKNNILIQSAQAMLAQANQVPQGVLQLLQ